ARPARLAGRRRRPSRRGSPRPWRTAPASALPRSVAGVPPLRVAVRVRASSPPSWTVDDLRPARRLLIDLHVGPHLRAEVARLDRLLAGLELGDLGVGGGPAAERAATTPVGDAGGE